MRKTSVFFTAILFFAAQPLAAQEEMASFVYEAYYAVDGAGMSDWNRQYREYSIPVLSALVEEGVIEGFGQYQHQTGGDEYNIRFVARTYDWASLGSFWSEYLSRLQAATPAAEWEANGRSIARHRDEIWDIEEANFEDPQNIDYTHMYASSFLVQFPDMQEWNDLWTNVVTPILEEARQEGTLVGWVKLDHNTGGPHNVKILYFVDGWDQLDDMFTKLGGTLQEEHADAFARFNELTVAHDDNIWVPTSMDDM
jgi:hypothetical protein